MAQPGIARIEVPGAVVALAVDEHLPLSQGVVQFDEGMGLEALQQAWPTLAKNIEAVECP
jgi:hypothetical protein